MIFVYRCTICLPLIYIFLYYQVPSPARAPPALPPPPPLKAAIICFSKYANFCAHAVLSFPFLCNYCPPDKKYFYQKSLQNIPWLDRRVQPPCWRVSGRRVSLLGQRTCSHPRLPLLWLKVLIIFLSFSLIYVEFGWDMQPGVKCSDFTCLDVMFKSTRSSDETRDEDPVLAKTRIRGSVPQTKRDF